MSKIKTGYTKQLGQKHNETVADSLSKPTLEMLKILNDRDGYNDRKELLKRMGFGKPTPPVFVENVCGKWINPYFAFKCFGQTGMPVDMMLVELTKQIGEDADKLWYEWCDFWLDTFLKGDHKKIALNFMQ